MERCLFHTQSDNVAGFCRHHNCAVTVKQMKHKNCLQKECRYLIKNEKHQYWQQREMTKQKRKARKQMIDNHIMKVTGGM